MTLPPGMVPYGPGHRDYPNEPRDWDGGLVARRDGCVTSAGTTNAWNHGRAGVQDYDIVGYSRKLSARVQDAFVRESTKPRIFADLDQAAIERVTLALGAAFVAEAAAALPRFADDDAIDPDAFAAGIVKAHLLGLVSILTAMERGGGSPLRTAALLRDIADLLGTEVAAARREAVAHA